MENNMNILKLWFASTELSSIIKLKLLREFETIENIFHYIKTHNEPLIENNTILNKLKKSYDLKKLEKVMDIMKSNDIAFVTVDEEQYPKELKNIEDPPYGLFYKGDISKYNNTLSVSIVGSRACSRYGIDVTKIITKELIENNVTIVSGMAKGIDAIAHKTAVDNNGYTVAVLGCGVDVIYPKENLKLYNDIISKGGCVLSEFVPGTRPLSMNFPIRNRIISGLSKLTIIAEAGEKSGTLITATKALEQGKDVIAVPGSIFSEESKGTNKLIKEGAHVFTEVDDIFYLLGIVKNKNNKIINDNIKSSVCEELYGLIDSNPIHIDDIMRITNIDIKRLYGLLFEMQLKEEILCLSGNFYVRVNKSI
jgi:DNA processing protein